jgi:hypothetical protein
METLSGKMWDARLRWRLQATAATSLRLRALLLVLLAATFVVSGCRGKEKVAEPEAFSFVVYPGARYLGQITESIKAAHRVMNPGEEPPPTAVYDVDAPIEQVAAYYAKQYGYAAVAAQAAPAGASQPQAYYRKGDLGADAKTIADLLKKMNLTTDVTKASGNYVAAEIAPRPNRPRVTIQRPYFDVVTSQVVDRTYILMTR